MKASAPAAPHNPVDEPLIGSPTSESRLHWEKRKSMPAESSKLRTRHRDSTDSSSSTTSTATLSDSPQNRFTPLNNKMTMSTPSLSGSGDLGPLTADDEAFMASLTNGPDLPLPAELPALPSLPPLPPLPIEALAAVSAEKKSGEYAPRSSSFGWEDYIVDRVRLSSSFHIHLALYSTISCSLAYGAAKWRDCPWPISL